MQNYLSLQRCLACAMKCASSLLDKCCATAPTLSVAWKMRFPASQTSHRISTPVSQVRARKDCWQTLRPRAWQVQRRLSLAQSKNVKSMQNLVKKKKTEGNLWFAQHSTQPGVIDQLQLPKNEFCAQNVKANHRLISKHQLQQNLKIWNTSLQIHSNSSHILFFPFFIQNYFLLKEKRPVRCFAASLWASRPSCAGLRFGAAPQGVDHEGVEASVAQTAQRGLENDSKTKKT